VTIIIYEITKKKMTEAEINELVQKMVNSENNAFKHADQLSRIGGEHVKAALKPLLFDENEANRHLAAAAIGKMKDNGDMLEPLMEAINAPQHQGRNGGMIEALEGFDYSDYFVDIFKLYLTPYIKASGLAKMMLDYGEFNITPRTLKKAEKHWKHFIFNTKHDEAFEEKKSEVEAIFSDLRELIGADQDDTAD
jgi:hypothetical protein